ncbi:MAG: 2-amino-4-hydroxy-6-hydroxymethyldihydropteridine diphosphokinase [Xanthomonadales bacterium]|nr:2-amino-4-hydroxy-6-hydroxymethyldihydropteridine diphosphokinase [Xanthomonadales bacterium]NIN60162.1 2-amino-4-hydroxy-6-hydroxymethyldihydropteridine diphosphokinase [Xanthomonadales bacterium]NIN74309.1 2-amino-4-hydroxy-6-hydroxymethyldihydropteridine diphosphokinase [Xanthomonadales bacterium]NIO12818.1 2-amino-4-hydroxy-6-hydroxymethyldihydropteridine diphosphokinase [Xanthomonadales bacterium]NIP12555.1 2-amino-4-hydroxy-6-hydroxymethyldihydropteridine diphosphokinase [Xanthomonadal
MSVAFLSLGSNIDAEFHIRAAVSELRAHFADCALSPIYRSRAVGFTGNDFINLVAKVVTPRSPQQLRHFLRALEDRFRRDRTAPKFSDRTLDIDILLFDDRVLDDRDLQLPRPEILSFAHVLKPLSDLAPDLVHPLERQTMQELWKASGLEGVSLEPVDLDLDGG